MQLAFLWTWPLHLGEDFFSHLSCSYYPSPFCLVLCSCYPKLSFGDRGCFLLWICKGLPAAERRAQIIVIDVAIWRDRKSGRRNTRSSKNTKAWERRVEATLVQNTWGSDIQTQRVASAEITSEICNFRIKSEINMQSCNIQSVN